MRPLIFPSASNLTSLSLKEMAPKLPPAPPSARTYCLYADAEGRPVSHWRDVNGPRVPGAVTLDGRVYPPRPEWIVRAPSAAEAAQYVLSSVRSQDTLRGEGIHWSRAEDDGVVPAPLSADTREWHALIAECGARTITLWSSHASAEEAKAVIDGSWCGGDCRRAYRIRRLTRAEAKLLRPLWMFDDEDES